MALMAILLFLGVVFWSTTWDTSVPVIEKESTAAITLWLWTGNSTSTAGLSSYFKRTPDLGIEILESGFIDGAGMFVESNEIPPNLNAAIRMKVYNSGKNSSTSWYFEASLPTDPPFTHYSDSFRPLQKNEERFFTLSFDKVTINEKSSIKLQIFSGDEEKNVKNNVAEESLTLIK